MHSLIYQKLRVFCLLWLTISADAGLNAALQRSSQQQKQQQKYQQEESDVVCMREHELKEMCEVLATPSLSTTEPSNISLLELNTRRSKRRRRTRTRTQTKELAKVGVDPFTISVVSTGIIWSTLYLVQLSTKALSMRWLKQRDRKNRDKIALAVKETCMFVSNVYDRLRFQKYAVMSVLEMFAADEEGNPVKLTSSTVHTHPEFQSWIEFLRELEYSMLTFYKMFGEDMLCQVFKEPPEFHFISTISDLFDRDGEDEDLDGDGDFVPVRSSSVTTICGIAWKQCSLVSTYRSNFFCATPQSDTCFHYVTHVTKKITRKRSQLITTTRKSLRKSTDQHSYVFVLPSENVRLRS